MPQTQNQLPTANPSSDSDWETLQPGTPEHNAALKQLPQQPASSDSDWQTVPTNGSQSSNDSDWETVQPGTPEHDSILDKAGHLIEDIVYPTLGAASGAILGGASGVEEGPGDLANIVAGGALGGMAGNEAKRVARAARGRSDLNPQGWGHVSDDAMAAAGGIMQELPAAMKSSQAVGQIIPHVLQDAEDMGIKLTPGTRGGRVLSWIENHMRSNPGTSSLVNQSIDKETNQSVLNAGRQLADHIAQASLGKDPQILGNTIQSAGESVQKAASDLYDHALDSINKQGAGSVPIKLDSNVQTVAKRMLDDLTANRGDFADAFTNQQDRQLAIQTLQEFANPTKTVDSAASRMVDLHGRPLVQAGSEQVDKVLPWNGARQLVSDLSALIRKGDTTLGKGALTQLKSALQGSMQTSLDAANPGLGTAFRNASTNYARVQDAMSNSVVQHLMENKSPEAAARYLLANGSAISNVQALQAAIGDKGASVVRGSLLNELLTQSTSKANATLKTPQLLAKWNGLGDAGQKVLFPDPSQRAAITKFMQVADRYALPIANKTSGQAAFGAGRLSHLTVGGLASAGTAALTHHIGFALPVLAGTAAFHIAPQLAVKLLQSPEGAEALAKAVSLPLGSTAQKVAIQSVMQIAHTINSDVSRFTQAPDLIPQN